MPVWIALWTTLNTSVDIRHQPFFLWIRDLSSPDALFTLPEAYHFSIPLIGAIMGEITAINVLPLLMTLTMYLQQKLSPAPPDPTQARIMMMLPFIFTFILAKFPAGLVIYWTWNNILSMAQQYVIMRRMGVPIGGKK